MESLANRVEEESATPQFRTARYRSQSSELNQLYKLYVLVFKKSARVSDRDIQENDATEIAAALAVSDRHNKQPRSIEVFFEAMRKAGYMAGLSHQDFPRRRVRAR